MLSPRNTTRTSPAGRVAAGSVGAAAARGVGAGCAAGAAGVVRSSRSHPVQANSTGRRSRSVGSFTAGVIAFVPRTHVHTHSLSHTQALHPDGCLCAARGRLTILGWVVQP